MTRSVLQDWVMELPLRAQGVLLTGIRGCDLATKPQVPTPERRLVQFLRYCVMVPADPREVDIPNAFFASYPPPNWKASELMHFPLHWYSHLMHCFQVVGYCRPVVSWESSSIAAVQDRRVRQDAWEIYEKMVDGLHLVTESKESMMRRLTEDRIEAGTVVS